MFLHEAIHWRGPSSPYRRGPSRSQKTRGCWVNRKASRTGRDRVISGSATFAADRAVNGLGRIRALEVLAFPYVTGIVNVHATAEGRRLRSFVRRGGKVREGHCRTVQSPGDVAEGAADEHGGADRRQPSIMKSVRSERRRRRG